MLKFDDLNARLGEPKTFEEIIASIDTSVMFDDYDNCYSYEVGAHIYSSEELAFFGLKERELTSSVE